MGKTKEVKSDRLKKLEKKLMVVEKSETYLEEEISKIKKEKEKLKEKIRKEKQAISFVNRAKRLRSPKKKKIIKTY